MILPNPGGKVGHRRTHTQKRAPETVPFFALKNKCGPEFVGLILLAGQ
jgi:hypothetical protein